MESVVVLQRHFYGVRSNAAQFCGTCICSRFPLPSQDVLAIDDSMVCSDLMPNLLDTVLTYTSPCYSELIPVIE
jgi:hypothetical protein